MGLFNKIKNMFTNNHEEVELINENSNIDKEIKEEVIKEKKQEILLYLV